MNEGDLCPKCGEGRLVKAYGLLGGTFLVHVLADGVCFRAKLDETDLYGEADG